MVMMMMMIVQNHYPVNPLISTLKYNKLQITASFINTGHQ